MQQPNNGPGYGVSYCPDWNGSPYVQDSIDETLFLRSMQSQDGSVFVYAQAFSDAAGASRFWVDDITLDIVWGTPPGQPTGLLAEPHNGTVTLRWLAPPSGTDPVTSYSALIFPAGGTPYQFIGQSGASTAVIGMLINGQPYSFEVAAISSAGQGPYSAMSNTVTPAMSLPYEAVSTQQFSLSNSNGVTWQIIGAGYPQGVEEVLVTPAVDSMALITGNADLWTSSAGVNQDLGIAVRSTPASTYPTVPGQPEAWKESGGYNGTFSPNAAAVQVALPLPAGTSYVIDLVWKSNKSSPGATIYAGAGPIGSDFSPTRLTVQLAPTAANRIVEAASTNQFHPSTASDGVAWTDLGTSSPTLHFVAPANGVAIVAGNADLWTTTAGFNQDLAISVNGSVAAWKESGSFGGTYSPNAALVETVMAVSSGATYDAKLQWKPNQASDQPPIYAGAGPIGTKYSPTRLTLYFIPNATLATSQASSSGQFVLPLNDGKTWRDVDAANLSLSITPPGDCLAILTGNADLWTTTAGFNQDLGIVVSSALGTYNADRVGWKESGAIIGTYSPNAAYVQTSFPMVSGTAYAVRLQWKSNRPQGTATIYAGAGAGAPYSPTRLTAQLVCPPVPVVMSASPSTGSYLGGTSVTITGSNLDQGTVFFGAAQAVITSNSSTQIVATSPAHTAGVVDVTVRTGNGTSATSAADHFTFVGPATHYAVTAPGSATRGVAFNFSVTALDQFGNQVTDYHFTVHFTSTDTAAVLPADYTFTAADAGMHTFAATLNTVGSRTITAGEVGAASYLEEIGCGDAKHRDPQSRRPGRAREASRHVAFDCRSRWTSTPHPRLGVVGRHAPDHRDDWREPDGSKHAAEPPGPHRGWVARGRDPDRCCDRLESRPTADTTNSKAAMSCAPRAGSPSSALAERTDWWGSRRARARSVRRRPRWWPQARACSSSTGA
jgi:hypothetical protein